MCIKLERHTRTIKYVSQLALEYTFTYIILQLESSKNYKVMLRFIQIPKFWNITSVTVNNSEVDLLKLVTSRGFACFSWCLGLSSRSRHHEKHWQTTLSHNWPKTSAEERNHRLLSSSFMSTGLVQTWRGVGLTYVFCWGAVKPTFLCCR